jgi:ClpP class serine protease
VGPSQSLYREVKRLREDGIPVVATIGAVGASGGYYVALAADSIFALPGSITGSIGVIMEYPEVSALMDRHSSTASSTGSETCRTPLRRWGGWRASERTRRSYDRRTRSSRSWTCSWGVGRQRA